MKNINWCLAFSIYFITVSSTANAGFGSTVARYVEKNNLEIPFFIVMFLIIGTFIYWAYFYNNNDDDE